jgi:hypothetical protein
VFEMAQEFRSLRISTDVTAVPLRPAALESVRCLDCSTEYAKPTGGGTLSTNPGCPRCGYVGWLPLSAPLNGPWRRDRFAADRLRRRLAPAG